MKLEVWKLSTDDDKYASLNCATDRDTRVYSLLNGTPILDTWIPQKVYHYTKPSRASKTRKPLPFSDFPGFLEPIFTPKTLAVLSDLLEPNGELLPLECSDGGEFYLFNAWRLEGAFDREKSECLVFPSSGRIMQIVKPIFFEEKIRDRAIFMISEPGGSVYVTRPFVDRVNEAGFTGFVFEELPQ